MKIDLYEINQHLDWVKLKMNIEQSIKQMFPRKKEIWWINIGQNIGVEINGKNNHFERPVIVIKVFNVESFLIVPLTSKNKKGQYMFEFIMDQNEMGFANLAQIRTVSIKRFIRKMNVLKDSDFDQLIEKIVFSLEKTETPACGVSSELPKGEPNEISITDRK